MYVWYFSSVLIVLTFRSSDASFVTLVPCVTTPFVEMLLANQKKLVQPQLRPSIKKFITHFSYVVQHRIPSYRSEQIERTPQVSLSCFGSPDFLVTVQQNTDFRTALKRIAELEVIVEQDSRSSLQFSYRGGTPFDASDLSAGQLDAILVLYGLHRLPRHSVALLDEPGQNLGDMERKLLQDHISRYAKDHSIQLIVVTHLSDMVDSTSTITRIDRTIATLPARASVDRRYFKIFFARGVILIEGFSDWLLLNVRPLSLPYIPSCNEAIFYCRNSRTVGLLSLLRAG